MANEKYQVFITGSNAKMLSREIATTLGGRYLTMEVMPYSFAEYARANGCAVKKNWKYGREAGRIARLCETYLRFGGFPEVLDYANKRAWLNGLYGVIYSNTESRERHHGNINSGRKAACGKFSRTV